MVEEGLNYLFSLKNHALKLLLYEEVIEEYSAKKCSRGKKVIMDIVREDLVIIVVFLSFFGSVICYFFSCLKYLLTISCFIFVVFYSFS